MKLIELKNVLADTNCLCYLSRMINKIRDDKTFVTILTKSLNSLENKWVNLDISSDDIMNELAPLHPEQVKALFKMINSINLTSEIMNDHPFAKEMADIEGLFNEGIISKSDYSDIFSCVDIITQLCATWVLLLQDIETYYGLRRDVKPLPKVIIECFDNDEAKAKEFIANLTPQSKAYEIVAYYREISKHYKPSECGCTVREFYEGIVSLGLTKQAKKTFDNEFS